MDVRRRYRGDVDANSVFFLPIYGTLLAAVSFTKRDHADRQIPAEPQLHVAWDGNSRNGRPDRTGAKHSGAPIVRGGK